MIKLLLVALCLFNVSQVLQQKAFAKDLVLGVVPQQAANVLAQKWVPIAQELSESTGYNVIFATAKSIPEFERQLSAGRYDIAYMNPYHYVVFSNEGQYEAVAMQANKTIKGILVKRKDTSIDNINELSGQSVAFPAPAAFAATLLPRAELKLREIEVEPKYVRSHDSVYMNVARGIFVAGGGIQRTFNTLSPEIKDQLEVFWTTQQYTPHAFAIRSDLNDELKQSISSALVNMHMTDKGKNALVNLGMFQLQPAVDKNWDDVRRLNLDSDIVVQQ